MRRNRITQKRCYYKNRIDQIIYSDVVWQRQAIIDKYDLLKEQGCEEHAIINVLQTSRATIYRWKNHFKKYGLIGLEPDSRSPKTVRKAGLSSNALAQRGA